jgi:Flp pilus assembly protein TadD
LGQYAQAVPELEKAAAALEKPDGLVYEHLGDAYAKTGRADKARDAWRRAIEIFRQDKEPEKAKRVEAKLHGK